MNVRIGGIIKTSLIDFPGRVSSVLFFQGCNFRCPYCYNVDVVLPERFTEPIPVKDVLSFLEKRKGLVDGVVLLGGEPLLQLDIVKFARTVKEMGFAVKLDTNGSKFEKLKEMVEKGAVDYVAMDVKAPLDFQDYHRVTNCSKKDFESVVKSVNFLINSDIDYELRTTLAPGLVEAQDILKIAGQIRGAKRYVIQNFFSQAPEYIDNSFKGRKSFPPWELEKLKEEIERNGEIKEVLVRK